MPILFPVNRISNGEFEFEDRKYILPINEPATNCHIHGFLHTAGFEVAELGESFVKCRYDSNEFFKEYIDPFKNQ